MRWDCHNCTLCCRLFELGPVAPEIIANLEALDIGASWEPARQGWYHETPRGYFLDHRDDSCVFLRNDGLCAVHALHGADAKPAFCRTFPFTVVEQPGGVTHGLRDDCGGTWRSLDTGTPVSEQIARLPPDAPRLVFGESPVQVLPGVGLQPTDWLTLEDQLVAQIQDDQDPRANIRAVRDALLGALRRSAPPADPQRASEITEGLRQIFVQTLGSGLTGAGPQGYAMRFMGQVHKGLVEATPKDPVPELSAKSRRYFAGVLRQHLRGKGFVAVGGVCWGLALFALGTEFARARAPGDTLAKLAPWHVKWSRFTRNKGALALLREHREPLWQALLLR
jgi:Fe-S-cluster containining protein